MRIDWPRIAVKTSLDCNVLPQGLQHMPKLKEMAKVKSIEICTLLTKRLPEPAKVSAKYVGFSIPNHFVVGCGLDYNEVYRDVKDIYIISQKGIEYDVNAEFHS